MSSTAKPGLALALTHPRGEPLLLGPFTKLRFDGPELFVEPGGLTARHADHRWALTTGHRYSRLESTHRLEVCFESLDRNSSRTLGPFDSFSAVDGILYADFRIIGVPLSAVHAAWTEARRVRELRSLLAAIDQVPARHVLVVSANNLLGIYLNDPDPFAWLRTREPTAVLGGCLYVFDLTGDADAIARVRALPAK